MVFEILPHHENILLGASQRAECVIKVLCAPAWLLLQQGVIRPASWPSSLRMYHSCFKVVALLSSLLQQLMTKWSSGFYPCPWASSGRYTKWERKSTEEQKAHGHSSPSWACRCSQRSESPLPLGQQLDSNAGAQLTETTVRRTEERKYDCSVGLAVQAIIVSVQRLTVYISGSATQRHAGKCDGLYT